MKTRKTSEVLAEALKVLEEEGWTKSRLHLDGRYCAIGAVSKVTGCVTSNGSIEYPSGKRYRSKKVLEADAALRFLRDARAKSLTPPLKTSSLPTGALDLNTVERDIFHYNDNWPVRKNNILAWFKRAIRLAKEAEA